MAVVWPGPRRRSVLGRRVWKRPMTGPEMQEPPCEQNETQLLSSLPPPKEEVLRSSSKVRNCRSGGTRPNMGRLSRVPVLILWKCFLERERMQPRASPQSQEQRANTAFHTLEEPVHSGHGRPSTGGRLHTATAHLNRRRSAHLVSSLTALLTAV